MGPQRMGQISHGTLFSLESINLKSVFMYHGVGRDEQLEGSDHHYAVTAEAFAKHLDIIGGSKALNVQIASGVISQHCVTFDDGHISHYAQAFPILKEKCQTGEFYVNTAFVGQTNYVTWEHLREMSDQGMSIQSHGHHHYYLSDLSESEQVTELETSKKTIEDKLGQPVTVLAPPGGRYDSVTERVASSLGYARIANSEPGCWKSMGRFLIPRFPVYQHTSEQTIADYLQAYSGSTLKAVGKYRVTRGAKMLLGNQRYEKIRNALVGEPQ